MKKDIAENENVVISGSLVDWGMEERTWKKTLR